MRVYFLEYMQKSNLDTLRKTAHQLTDLYEENRAYNDAEFIRIMIRTLEHAIQQIGGTKWTVARSRKDMRGKMHTRKGKRVVVPNRRLQHELAKTMMGDLEKNS